MKYLAFCLVFLGCTETQKRKIKNLTSEYTGGLNRICTVYANDGQQIQSFKGSFDIEKNQNKIQFILKGKRISIYNSPVICQEL